MFNRKPPNFLSDRHCYSKPCIIYRAFSRPLTCSQKYYKLQILNLMEFLGGSGLSLDRSRLGLGDTDKSFNVALTDPKGYYTECWWTLNNTNDSITSGNTTTVYSDLESNIASGVFGLFAVLGSILNFVLIIAIMKSPQIRQEYLTPTLVSILVTDFGFSIYFLTILSSAYYTR